MWDILADKNFDKKLHKIHSNKDAHDKYKTALSEMIHSPNPQTLGDRKRGHLRHLYAYRLTRSYRLLYSIDYAKNTIVLVDLDDHKNLYGKD